MMELSQYNTNVILNGLWDESYNSRTATDGLSSGTSSSAELAGAAVPDYDGEKEIRQDRS
jgi:hypothetical protein